MSYDNQADISLTDLNEERIVNLPDLSDFQESEKKHIVSVLLRNEDLRDKHLERFMNIRKEVADLEEQPAPTSPQVCARCLTQFGMLFNTGDPCPKCGAKVCKQCRRMYNVNDNNWLCKLCCKKMQLLSYSGEWIYELHSNLRKPSTSPSEMREDSFPLSVSTQNINMISSSDSEPEDSTKTAKPDRSSTKSVTNQTAKKKAKPKDKSRPLIVQNAADEQKLKYLKERMKERPLNSPHTQPLPRRNPKINSPNHTMKSSSDAINSLTNNSQDGTLNKTKPPANKQLDYLKVREKPLDLISVTSSEWNFDDDDDDEIDIEMENIKRSQADLSQPSIRNNRSSVSSTATVKKARHKRISSSVHNLREKMHRIPHPHLSSSRTSLNSQKTTTSEMPVRSNINNEDTISIKVNDIPLKSGM